MGLKKKKNIIILSAFIVACNILYQLYFFLTISSANIDNKVVPVLDYETIKDFVHTRTNRDKYVNSDGVTRGINLKNVKDYQPDSDNEFTCLTSHQKIPYEYVNDDYCDCEDGTDEPSTTACPNGIFYCEAKLRRLNEVFTVPSNKVNDGICDCCDGSDEFDHPNGKKILSQNILNQRFYVFKCSFHCAI